nr:methyltransferase domain-containing protein [uncultured Methanospirillum sp.]
MDRTTAKTSVQKYWNQHSKYYDTNKLGSVEECNAWKMDFKDIFGDKPQKILDVGTGTGFIGLLLSESGHSVTGLDFSEQMMEYAKKKARDYDISYTFVVGDAEHPDFPDNTFDSAVCRYLLWTLPNPQIALTEWKRVVKPGGIICVIDGQWELKGIKQKICSKMLRLYRYLFLHANLSGSSYSHDLNSALPHSKGVPLETLVTYFKTSGLEDIRVKDFTHIRLIQKKNLPWFLKYAFFNDTYGVWGQVGTKSDSNTEKI